MFFYISKMHPRSIFCFTRFVSTIKQIKLTVAKITPKFSHKVTVLSRMRGTTNQVVTSDTHALLLC